VFRGAILTINQWGMRDREYRREKTPGTFRIATVGASTTMGWGVADEETYENLVETRLNRDGIASMPVARFESLNFSVPGHIPPEQLGQLDTVFAFAPDAVFVTAQDNDIERTIPRLVHYVNQGIYLPFDTISALSHRVVGGARSEAEAEERLNAYAGEILRWFYTEIVARCRARGVLPIWVYIPQLERYATAEERRIMFDAAREAGFVILDLSDAFEGHPRADLVVTEWDRHPNVLGHRLLATALYRALQAHPEIFLGGGGAGR
jgi:lysophospholipase L1-like esterase